MTVIENHDQVLAERDHQRRIYLCEYGIVHLVWNENNLVYCPGDLIGLSYLLSSLNEPCDLGCLRGERCNQDHGDGIVHLPYGSVRLPLTVQECQELHLALQEAVDQLQTLRKQGYFARQEWLPQAPTGKQRRARSKASQKPL